MTKLVYTSVWFNKPNHWSRTLELPQLAPGKTLNVVSNRVRPNVPIQLMQEKLDDQNT